MVGGVQVLRTINKVFVSMMSNRGTGHLDNLQVRCGHSNTT